MPSGMVQIHRIVSRPPFILATIEPIVSAMMIWIGTTASVSTNVFSTERPKLRSVTIVVMLASDGVPLSDTASHSVCTSGTTNNRPRNTTEGRISA
ncbi:hypothetical protein D3C71_1002300 [compost metagenome]